MQGSINLSEQLFNVAGLYFIGAWESISKGKPLSEDVANLLVDKYPESRMTVQALSDYYRSMSTRSLFYLHTNHEDVEYLVGKESANADTGICDKVLSGSD